MLKAGCLLVVWSVSEQWHSPVSNRWAQQGWLVLRGRRPTRTELSSTGMWWYPRVGHQRLAGVLMAACCDGWCSLLWVPAQGTSSGTGLGGAGGGAAKMSLWYHNQCKCPVIWWWQQDRPRAVNYSRKGLKQQPLQSCAKTLLSYLLCLTAIQTNDPFVLGTVGWHTDL